MKLTYTKNTNKSFENSVASFQYNILSFPNSAINGRLVSYKTTDEKVEAKITATNGAEEGYTAVFTLINQKFTLTVQSTKMSKHNLERVFDWYVQDLNNAEFLN